MKIKIENPISSLTWDISSKKIAIIFTFFAFTVSSSPSYAMGEYHCPGEFNYSEIVRACVSDSKVLVNKTNSMTEECRAKLGLKSCTEDVWHINAYKRFRGNRDCPKGSSYDSAYKVCVSRFFGSKVAIGPFTVANYEICKKNKWGRKCDNMSWSLEILDGKKYNREAVYNDESLYCPPGSSYNVKAKVCMNETEALGPFPREMTIHCKSTNSAKKCDSQMWDLKTVQALRGYKKCPRGSQFDDNLGVCLDTVRKRYAFGPFLYAKVKKCRADGWGPRCDTMRWSINILKGRKNPKPPAPPPKKPVNVSNLNEKLYQYYSRKAGYDAVYKDVMRWFGTTSNGCVAFMSSALRKVGLSIPKTTNKRGENYSTLTRPFSEYLEHNLGWVRITDSKQLKRGDVVFTEDHKDYPMYPAHTYMFAGWKSFEASGGLVVDNQRFMGIRNVFGYASGNFTPFQYALRSPK